MKKNLVFLSIFIVICFPFTLISSQKRISISINPNIAKIFGSTKYHISFIQNVSDTNIFGESELEFPLDVLMPGINAGVNAKLWEKASLSLNLNIHKNIGNPNNTMRDSDWFTYPYPGGEKIEWSYTESRANIIAEIIGAEQSLKFFISQNTQASIILGYRYSNFSYDLFGVSGWQLDSTGHRVYFDEYQGIKMTQGLLLQV